MFTLLLSQVPQPLPEGQGKRLQEQAHPYGAHSQAEGR